MTGMNKISFEALEEITGGKIVTVANGAVNYANVRVSRSRKTAMYGMKSHCWTVPTMPGSQAA